MGCEVRTHLADYLAGTLSPDAGRTLSAHLDSCRDCALEFQSLAETWRALEDIPPDQPDVASMRGRFDAMLAGYQEAARVTPAGGFRSVVRWAAIGRAAVWAGAAAAMLLLGVTLGRVTAPEPREDAQASVLREELGHMRQLLTLTLLQQQSASERLKAVSSAGQIDRPGDELTVALLDALMHDPNVNVRMATVDALKRFADRDSVRHGLIEALTRQTSPLVQIALIDFVVETNSREAVEALRQLSNDTAADEAVRARAAAGLTQVGA